MTPPAQARDPRGFASEIKFVVDPATGKRIAEWARAHLAPDPYGAGPFADQYRTATLYFDTDELDVFHARGSYGRSKYRLRRYDGEAVAFCERKLKRATLLRKRRTVVRLEDLTRLTRASGAMSARAGQQPAASLEWAGSWFEHRLLLRRLRPVCQIGYHRLARVATADTGPIRLTLDEDVRAMDVARIEFTGAEGATVLPQAVVLELKYRLALPAVFKRLVEEFRLTPQRVSKYRSAVDALGLAGDDRVTTPACMACSG